MTFTDKGLTCVDCGDEFIDRAKDQQFRFDHGWVDKDGNVTAMKRCGNCRKIRRENKIAQFEKKEGGDYGRKPRKFYK